MVGKTISLILLCCVLRIEMSASSFRYYYYSPASTLKMTEACKLFNLKAADIDSLLAFNKLSSSNILVKGKRYKMPIRVYVFDGTSIRSTVGIENYNTTLSIQKYNEWAEKEGIKKELKKLKEIWIPISFLVEKKAKFEPYEICYKLLGKECEKVIVNDNKLKGHLFYLISGHGGPDPGANCKKDSNLLCEDEYAYDIILRLARNLISQEAKVIMVVTDKNDGIRDESFLAYDSDETAFDEMVIPLNQIERLKQRTDQINKLYRTNEKKYIQRLIEVHIDSRHETKKIDLFFYHYPGSADGKKLAENLLETVKSKYNTHQKSRGYNGIVQERNLYSLRKTLPTSVYIEVGNITNEFDQRRILIANNRQAMANWLAEGLMK